MIPPDGPQQHQSLSILVAFLLAAGLAAALRWGPGLARAAWRGICSSLARARRREP